LKVENTCNCILTVDYLFFVGRRKDLGANPLTEMVEMAADEGQNYCKLLKWIFLAGKLPFSHFKIDASTND
jgi:hypothetical protein